MEVRGRADLWAAVYGVAQSRTRLKQLSSSSSFPSRSQLAGHLLIEALLDCSSKVSLGLLVSFGAFRGTWQSFCSMVCVSLLDYMLPEGEASDFHSQLCARVWPPADTHQVAAERWAG